ncbi:MAG: hypothetical protein JNK25_11500 [Phycisphaerae bacterium]|nr:hypothetical protein [Phycisphaerae bacterium]
MTILHLVRPVLDPAGRGASDAQAVVCSAAIAAAPGLRHRVLIIGGERARRRAYSMGLHSHGSVGTLLGRSLGLGRLVARVARVWNANDTLQVYGPEEAELAEATSIPHVERLDCSARAVPGETAEFPSIGDFGGATNTRSQARAMLGCDESEFVVLALGDPPSEVEAHPVGEMLGMLTVGGVPVVGVFPSGAKGLFRVARHAREGYVRRVRAFECPVWGVLPAADLAVVSPASSGITLATRLLVRHAARLGIAVVIPHAAGVGVPTGAVIRADDDCGAHLASACHRWMKAGRALVSWPPGEESTIGAAVAARWTRG